MRRSNKQLFRNSSKKHHTMSSDDICLPSVQEVGDRRSTGVSMLMNLMSWPRGHSLVVDATDEGLGDVLLTAGLCLCGESLAVALFLLSDLRTVDELILHHIIKRTAATFEQF